jgi:serine/threonine protein kinase
LDTQFAVKRIPKAKLPPSYFNEARHLYYARHRHVVEIKYAVEDNDYVYLAMPFYRGGSLQSLLEARYLTSREIVRYGIEFLSGLHHVHVRKLIHFDVKPTNVLLDDSDTATLADFGLCREMDSTGRVLMWNVYRPHAPPEFTPSSKKVSRTADIYQAGLTLYRMCAGHSEFERQAVRHGVGTDNGASIRTGAFPERQRFLAHIPPRLQRIVSKALHLDPPKRYGSVLEMMNALALVDESLDWSYQQGADWGEGAWHESGTASSRRVTLSRTGTKWEVMAHWVFPTGRERRFSRFNQSGLSEAAAKRLVQEALTETWSSRSS